MCVCIKVCECASSYRIYLEAWFGHWANTLTHTVTHTHTEMMVDFFSRVSNIFPKQIITTDRNRNETKSATIWSEPKRVSASNRWLFYYFSWLLRLEIWSTNLILVSVLCGGLFDFQWKPALRCGSLIHIEKRWSEKICATKNSIWYWVWKIKDSVWFCKCVRRTSNTVLSVELDLLRELNWTKKKEHTSRKR